MATLQTAMSVWVGGSGNVGEVELRISQESKKRLRGFAYSLTAHSQQTLDVNGGFWISVPHELLNEAAEWEVDSQTQLSFDQKERLAYYGALQALTSDPALDYLSPKDVEKALRRFSWKLYLAAMRSGDLKQEVTKQFIEELEKPIREFTVLYPIQHLQLPNDGLEIGAVSFRTLTQDLVDIWHLEELHIFSTPQTGDVVATCKVIAGSPATAHERAKVLVDEALDAIRISVLNLLVRIHDFQLRFRRLPSYYTMSGTGNEITRSAGRFNESVFPLELNGEVLGKSSAETLNRISLVWDSQVNHKLRADFSRAVRWMGKSIVAHSFDEKVLSLCIALECLLSDRSSGLKSVDICRRSIVLGELAGEGFFHPAEIIFLYELRSSIVHGAALEIGTEEDYRTLLRLAVDVLQQAADMVNSTPTITNRRMLFRVLDDPKKLSPLLAWCKKEDPKRLKDLIADIESRVE